MSAPGSPPTPTTLAAPGARMEPSPGAASDADARASAAAAEAALQREHLSLLEKEVKRVGRKLRSAETLAHVDAMLADVRRARASLEDAADAADARVCVDAFQDMMRRTNYPSRVRSPSPYTKAVSMRTLKSNKTNNEYYTPLRTGFAPSRAREGAPRLRGQARQGHRGFVRRPGNVPRPAMGRAPRRPAGAGCRGVPLLPRRKGRPGGRGGGALRRRRRGGGGAVLRDRGERGGETRRESRRARAR